METTKLESPYKLQSLEVWSQFIMSLKKELENLKNEKSRSSPEEADHLR